MSEPSVVLAKLSGIKKALSSVLSENVSRNRSGVEILTRSNFSPELVQHYFSQATVHIEVLKNILPNFYGDFQDVKSDPEIEIGVRVPGESSLMHFSRAQVDRLIRDIDQVFEIRANSELEQPKQALVRKVFITHGHSSDWRLAQPFIEKDIGIPTIELAQEANMGRTLIEKLIENSARCNCAVIVMTADDIVNEEEARVRENVMHEIGFFQGRYGRNFVILLHEDGTSIPTNLSGVAYVPFPKGNIEAGFHVLQRELKAIYSIR